MHAWYQGNFVGVLKRLASNEAMMGKRGNFIFNRSILILKHILGIFAPIVERVSIIITIAYI